MKTPSIRPRLRREAFTLPEVVVAVGIAALGLVSLLGIVPQSLDTLRQAGEVSSESRIAQQIFAGISMSDWQDAGGKDLLGESYHGKRYCYDDLAVEMNASGDDFGVAYVAEVSVSTADVALPQDGVALTSPDPHLRRVTVKVANTGSASFDFVKARASGYRTYASIVSRTGK